MKVWHVILVAGAVGAGVYVYRRGKDAHDAAGGLDAGVGPVLRAGLRQVAARVVASTTKAPGAGAPGDVEASNPTEASEDPHLTKTAPTHARFRITATAPESAPLSLRALIAQGIGF